MFGNEKANLHIPLQFFFSSGCMHRDHYIIIIICLFRALQMTEAETNLYRSIAVITVVILH